MNILLYHGTALGLDSFEEVFQKHILITEFRRQMDVVRKKYNVLTTEEFLYKWEKKTLSETDTLICFDDCYRNVMNAAEVLTEFKLPALFSISSDIATRNYSWTDDIEKAILHTKKQSILFADFYFDLSTTEKRFRTILILKDYFKNLIVAHNQVRLSELLKICEVNLHEITDDKFNMLGWEDVRKLQSLPGFTIAHHGHGHYPMSKFHSATELAADIRENIRIFEEQLGIKPYIFTYPFGMAEHYDETVKAELKKQGFSYAFAVRNQKVDYVDPYEISRIELNPQRFRALVEEKI